MADCNGEVVDADINHTPNVNAASNNMTATADVTATDLGDRHDRPSRGRHREVIIDRPVYTQLQFDEGFEHTPRRRKTIKEHLKNGLATQCECSKECLKRQVKKRLPFIRIMRNYKLKEWLLSDIISGLTVGIMHIPQGMGYALLAALAPINGLYVSFFSSMIYFFLGTSLHISLGTIAVTSLMVGSVVEKHVQTFVPIQPSSSLGIGNNLTNSGMIGNYTLPNGTVVTYSDIPDAQAQEFQFRVQVATAVTLATGIIQIVMGMLRLGFLTIYLSDPLISGFTTGAACYVFTSQVKYIFSLNIKRCTGPFNLICTYIEVFTHIGETKVASIIISGICMVILVITKECINPRVRKKIKAPVPVELFLLIVVTAASHFGRFHENFQVKTVGEIPTGIPAFTPPPTDLIKATFSDAIALAVVAFAISVSLAKIFAKKHNYEVDSNQELISYGAVNTITSFLSCYVAAASLSRSSVQESVGGRTQLAGFIAIWLVFIVILYLGPLFSALPNCVLSAIIVVALKGLFLQFRELKRLWYICKIDFSVWLVTFFATVILDVDIGLLIGVTFSFFTVVFRTQRARGCILGRVPQTDIYASVKEYKAAKEIPGIKIFRFEASLCYANKDHFKEKLYRKTELDPTEVLRQREKLKKKAAQLEKKRKSEEKKDTVAKINENKEVVVETEVATEEPLFEIPSLETHHIIIDFSTMGTIDSVAVHTISSVIEEYSEIGVEVKLAEFKGGVREVLEAAGSFEKIGKQRLYISVHDAVLSALDYASRKFSQADSRHNTPVASRVQSLEEREMPPDVESQASNGGIAC